MIKFRNLFCFSKKEIDAVFAHAQSVKRAPGLKLIQAPLGLPEHSTDTLEEAFGKLLIVVPRKTGKAHVRNLLRRRAKAIFYAQKLYKKPVKSILSIYAEAANLSFDQLQAFLVSNLK